MRVVIAPDKFRGSLTAVEAAQAIAQGVARAAPTAFLDLAPLADGGEGFVETIVAAAGGTWQTVMVSGPLGDPTPAKFALLDDEVTAVLAMATASGLSLLPADQREPTRASTRGTGEVILAALALGATRLILGIGGSATNDGGAGMAQALGYRLLDDQGSEIPPGGGSLHRLRRIDRSMINPMLGSMVIEVACDVANPLCGPNGASAVYGPQKGAKPDQIEHLDANLAHLAQLIGRDLGVDVFDVPGGGAAGGLGAGLIAFTGATLRPGIDLVMAAVRLRERLTGADLCITGEGCLDASSAAGKTVAGVASLARSLGVPTLALAGTLGPGAEQIQACGVLAYFSICPGPGTLDQAVAAAGPWLANVAEQATRAFLAGRDQAQ